MLHEFLIVGDLVIDLLKKRHVTLLDAFLWLERVPQGVLNEELLKEDWEEENEAFRERFVALLDEALLGLDFAFVWKLPCVDKCAWGDTAEELDELDELQLPVVKRLGTDRCYFVIEGSLAVKELLR